MSPLPENLEKVADAGGWDEHALAVMKEMKSIKKEEWDVIHSTLKTLKGFTDATAVEFFTANLTDSIQLKFEEIIAPLKNEWNDLINKLLEPLMPLLQKIVEFLIPLVQFIADSIQSVMDFLFGGGSGQKALKSFADFFRDYKAHHPLATSMEILNAYLAYVANDYMPVNYGYDPDRIGGLQID